MKYPLFFLVFPVFFFLFSSSLLAQEPVSCPCENCPRLIEDLVPNEVSLNIFGLQKNDLSLSDQCVSRVGVKFTHDYVGDIQMELVSPAGQSIKLIGSAGTFISNGRTSNTFFDVSFVPSSEGAAPEAGLDAKWNNDQEWGLIGVRGGSYYPFQGNLEDFNSGRANGTWTLRWLDVEGRDAGEVEDFYIEFCDSEGLVCDPCLDPEDDPCTFVVDPAEAVVVPAENFCLPIYTSNVAFLETMQFDLQWNPQVLEFTRVDSFRAEFLNNEDFNFDNIANGELTIDYQHSKQDIDSLGLVVKDSTALFQVCFQAIGNVGDTTDITVPSAPMAVQVDGTMMPTISESGKVQITVDSTADCVNAIRLCGNSPVTVKRLRDAGFDNQEGGDCFAENREIQSRWFVFDALETGDLSFAIRPAAPAVFGFSLFKNACPSDPSSELVECKSSIIPLVIGASDNPQEEFGEAGGSGFVPAIEVDSGSTFYLLVNNFEGNQAGFDLEFGEGVAIGDKTLSAVIAPAPPITCTNQTVRLDAGASSWGAKYDYAWKTDTGSIDTNGDVLNPLILKGGQFTLEITDKVTGCAVADSALVITDQQYPTAEGGAGGLVDCTQPVLELDSDGASIGSRFEVLWSTEGGVFRGDPTERKIQAEAGGVYYFQIIDVINGCLSIDSVEVQQNFQYPDLTLRDTVLTCTNPVLEVQATSSTDSLSYAWQGSGIISDPDLEKIRLNDTGWYFVAVTAPNGCITEDSLYVMNQQIFPIAEAGGAFRLDCAQPAVRLDGTESSRGTNMNYLWKSETGHFVDENSVSGLIPEVDSGGWYFLEVTNIDNGCQSVDSVFIDTSFRRPMITIATDTVLTCFQPEIKIDASQSDSGANFSYDWFVGTSGNIVSGRTSYQPIINQAGEYVFNLMDNDNQCISSHFINITANQNLPDAEAGEEQTLDCNQPVLALSAEGSSTGAIFDYQWTSPDGNILEDSLQFSIRVDQPAVYSLKVSNTANGCHSSDSVIVRGDFDLPEILPIPDTSLTCREPLIDLMALSPTDGVFFEWFFEENDRVTSGEQLQISEPGQYYLKAVAPNGCSDSVRFTVSDQLVLPTVAFLPPDTLTCRNQSVIIDASSSTQGDNFSYAWTTTSGNFLNGTENSYLPAVITEGFYTLNILNEQTGCARTDSVFVKANQEYPDIGISTLPDTIDCIQTRVTVTAVTDVENAAISWKMEGQDVANTADLTVEKAGLYSLLIINRDNECSSRTQIEIVGDTINPVAEAGENQQIDCSTNIANLSGATSSIGDEFRYFWTDKNGDEVAGEQEVTVNEPGLYSLIVVNRRNGCRAIDTVRVTESLENPIADAGETRYLCEQTEEPNIQLGGKKTSEGEQFLYQWSLAGGGSLGTGRTQLATAPDEYILQVTNQTNSCVATDTVSVFSAPRPDVTVVESGGLNCRDSLLQYIAKSDLPASAFVWETANNVLIKSDTLSVSFADAGRTFILTVTDTITGCATSGRQVEVKPDENIPRFDIGEQQSIKCADTLQLSVSLLSVVDNPVLLWETSDGNIIANANSLTPQIDAAGTYILTVIDTDNFCEKTDSLSVLSNQQLPEVDLGNDTLLTCLHPSLQLKSVAPESPAYAYEWRKDNDQLVGANRTLEVESAGFYQLKITDTTNLCSNFDFIQVIDSTDLPQVNISTPEKITCSRPLVSLNVAVSSPSHEIEWSALNDSEIIGDITALAVEVAQGGAYQVEVIDPFTGCKTIEAVEVEDVTQNIRMEAGNDQILNCFNDTTTNLVAAIFSDTTNLIYRWTSDIPEFSPSDNSLILEVENGGNYIFWVEDTLSDCIVTDTLTVQLDIEQPDYSLPDSLILSCSDNNLIIGDSANIPDEWRFNWTTNEGNILSANNQSFVAVNDEGQYQVSVRNITNGCTVQDTVLVAANQKLPDIDIGTGGVLTCEQEQLELGGPLTAKGPAYQYYWSTDTGNILSGERTAFAVVNEPGTYSLTVLDTTSNCQSTDNIFIRENTDKPVVNSPDNLGFTCVDDQVVIQISTSVHPDSLNTEWVTQDGLIMEQTSSEQIVAGSPGTYLVRVGNAANSCVTIDSIIVQDRQQLPAVPPGQDVFMDCVAETIVLSSQGAATGSNIQYEWTNSQGASLSTGADLVVENPGTYQLTVLNTATSCEATASFAVIQADNPPTGAALFVDLPTCLGADDGQIEVLSIEGGSPPFQYQLSGFSSQNTPFFSDLPPNNYQLMITDSLNCEWDTLLELTQPRPLELSLFSEQENLLSGQANRFFIETSLSEEEIVEINWSPAGISTCTDCFEIMAVLNEPTELIVEVVSENGCRIRDSLWIEVSLPPVPNAITPNDDGANDEFVIPQIANDPEEYPDNELTIFNRWGDIVFRAAPYQNDWMGQNQSGQPLPEGTYYYIIRLKPRQGIVEKGNITILR